MDQVSLLTLLNMFKDSTQPDPSLHTPFMQWVDDTATPVLKRRTADNTGWYVVSDSGGGGGAGSYTHIQGAPSASWSITHSLGVKPNIQIYNTSDEVIMPQSITHTDVNSCTVTFASAVDGEAICVG